jgi:protein TonB
MNGMSYGNPSPPLPNARQAMNLSLPMSDSQAVLAPELAIKGDIGADWDAELTKWVNDHKYYPQAAAEQNQQGNVQIEFTVDRAGNVTGLHLLNGSGSPFLDQAWLGLFQDNTLPAFPPGTKADHVTVDATMHFELIQ